MLKQLILAVAICLSPLVSYAQSPSEDQVTIAENERIYNPDKQCVFCSIEMLANIADEDRLYGLSRQFVGPCNMSTIADIMASRGVHFKINHHGYKSDAIAQEYLLIPCKYDRRGVVVGIDYVHVVNLMHYDIENKVVRILDNSDPMLEVRTWDWDEFHRRWDGYAIVIYGKNDKFPRHKIKR